MRTLTGKPDTWANRADVLRRDLDFHHYFGAALALSLVEAEGDPVRTDILNRMGDAYRRRNRRKLERLVDELAGS